MLENIFNANTKILIFAKDKNLKFIFCNEAVAEATGLDSPSQVVGKNDYELSWKTEAELYRRDDQTVLNGGIIFNKMEYQTQPTKVATLLISKSILTDKNENPNGIVGHAIDITGYHITKNNGVIDLEKNIFYLGPHFSNEYLTKCEFTVFKYLLMGKCVDAIARHLSRSVKTIQAQIKSIANKLQCSHKSEIVPTAVKYGLTHVLGETSLKKK